MPRPGGSRRGRGKGGNKSKPGRPGARKPVRSVTKPKAKPGVAGGGMGSGRILRNAPTKPKRKLKVRPLTGVMGVPKGVGRKKPGRGGMYK